MTRLLLAGILVGCAPAPDAPTGPPLSFAEVVEPILERSCVEGCHVTGASGPNSLETAVAYRELVDAPSREVPLLDRVEPGVPELSYVLFKLRGEQADIGGMGSRMPPDEPLISEEIELITRWIEQGAAP
jgi:hypothetical protein